MTSKQRAYLKGLAMTMDPLFQIGKSSLTPEVTTAVEEALEARELIKVNVGKNCMDDPREIASMLSNCANISITLEATRYRFFTGSCSTISFPGSPSAEGLTNASASSGAC